MATTEKERRHQDKQERPPVDNQKLAAMLRDSATIVERGEFDALLYDALQDFRTYYKEHYPAKKSARSSSKSRPTRTGSSSSVNVKSTSPVPNGGTSSERPASAEAGLSKSVDATADVGKTETESATPETLETVEKSVPAESSAAPPAPADPKPELETPTVAAPTKAEFVENSNPVSPEIKADSVHSNITSSSAEPPSATRPTIRSTQPSSASTIQKATAGMFFNRVRGALPKVHMSPNTAAFSATSRKNAERAKDDVESLKAAIIGGPMASQAESSRRRRNSGDPSNKTHSNHERVSRGEPASNNTFPDVDGLAYSAAGHASFTVTSSTFAHEAQQHPVSGSQRGNLAGSDSTISPVDSSSPTVGGAGQEVLRNPSSEDPAFSPREATEDDTNMESSRTPSSLRPAFQRPANAKSSLIANGWIEQHRRSKMRHVWKEVLASLVQGRGPGEETTLWIQREITNVLTGKKELEALHQIPVKLIESCTYLDFTTDNRFTLKLMNATEEFLFRSHNDSSSSKWVQVLKEQRAIARGDKLDEEKKGSDGTPPRRMSIAELRAICHGAGVNTMGMERPQLERAADEVLRRGTFFPPPPNAPQPIPFPTQQPAVPPQHQQQSQQPQQSTASTGSGSVDSSQTGKLSYNELRAICHGAGINTVGMERQQLVHAAEEVLRQGTYFPPPNSSSSQQQPPPPARVPVRKASSAGTAQTAPAAPSSHPQTQQHSKPPQPTDSNANSGKPRLTISELRAICHGAGINTVGMERQQLEKAADEVVQRGTFFPPKSSASAPDELEAARRREQEEHARQAEEQRRRMQQQREQEAAAAAAAAAAEQQRRAAEQQAAEQRRRYAEQHAAWQKQRQEEEHHRRVAEQQAAEERRRREEAMRRQQQWHQQWNQQHHQHQQPWPPQQAHPQQQYQHRGGWHPQHPHSAQQQHQQPHPQPQSQAQNSNQQQQQYHSAASEKYAKMANASGDDGQAAITRIKHDILIQWALQPPHLQMLRPIDALVTSIHKVFPPALGVKGHEYFQKWKALGQADISNSAGLPDEEKLKKAVRKIRFFLHPDKRPKDLNAEQEFLVKMLWDVTNDALEEFEKRQEDLDWVK